MTALGAALTRWMHPDGGFVPPTVPVDRLPEPFDRYLDACDELPHRFAAGCVRAWLSDRYAARDPDVTRAIGALDDRQRARLRTVLSILGHAWRWQRVPPPPEALALRTLALPPGLGEPWDQVSRLDGVPRVGTMWTLVLENWVHRDLPPGSVYRAADLTRDRVRLAQGWLLPPDDALLAHWSLLILETEARGAPVVRAVVAAIDAATAGDGSAVGLALEQLRADFDAMVALFVRGVRDAVLDPDRWATHVGPIYGWGLPSDDGELLEGLSGMQFGAHAAVSAGLGVPATSALARATRNSRRYLPPPQRAFLDALDAAAPALVGFLRSSGDPGLRRRYDEALQSLASWRTVHRQRGARYVRASVERVGPGGSTGMTLHEKGDPVAQFEDLMTARIDETRAAELGAPSDPGSQDAP